MAFSNVTAVRAVGISGSPSSRSKSRALLEHALASLAADGASTRPIDLATLSADALLGRARSADVDDALAAVAAADVVVVATPVYRATYSGLLKVFFDLFPPNALAGKTAVALATGGGPGHLLVLDHGLRPLLASVGALVVPTAVYGTDAGFADGVPDDSLRARADRAVLEALALARRARQAVQHSSTHVAG